MVKVIKISPAAAWRTYGDRHRLSMGFPTGGSMDKTAMLAANYLCENLPFAPVWEVMLYAPVLQFTEACRIAVTGADINPKINGQAIPQEETVFTKAGDIFTGSAVKNGVYAYLGFSFDPRRGDFAEDGSIIRKGDIFRTASPPETKTVVLPGQLKHIIPDRKEIRILPGPETALISPLNLEDFTKSTFSVTNEINRMGIRLAVPQLPDLLQKEIVSSVVMPGTIQLPAGGTPIVMMADHQTMGGYPRIAQVIAADLDTLAQFAPGTDFKFRFVTTEKARRLLIKRTAGLSDFFRNQDAISFL